MDKNQQSERQKMTDISATETDPDALVSEAAGWAMALWKRAAQLYGDKQDTAMHTAARWAGVPPTTFWRLRYRRPNDLGVSTYNRIKVAHHRHVASVEATSAQNLIALRSLPSTPARDRLVAQLEEYLGIEAGETPRATAERTN